MAKIMASEENNIMYQRQEMANINENVAAWNEEMAKCESGKWQRINGGNGWRANGVAAIESNRKKA